MSLFDDMAKREKELLEGYDEIVTFDTAGDREQPLFISVYSGSGEIYQLYYPQLLSRVVTPFKDDKNNKSGYILPLETSNVALKLYLINFTKKDFSLIENALRMAKIDKIFEYNEDIQEIDKPVIKLEVVRVGKD